MEWSSHLEALLWHEKWLLICPVEDHINGHQLTLAELFGVVNQSVHKGGWWRSKRNNYLPNIVKLAVGMKVMVTANMETDLNVTNGARGEICSGHNFPPRWASSWWWLHCNTQVSSILHSCQNTVNWCIAIRWTWQRDYSCWSGNPQFSDQGLYEQEKICYLKCLQSSVPNDCSLYIHGLLITRSNIAICHYWHC